MHTFRFVTDDGDSKLIKWHFKTRQGKASLVWEEAQILAGQNADYHRQDLWEAIESGNGPEWELCAQIIDEEDALAFGFDVLDATKIIPEEYAPLHKLGVLKLDANPVNYFAETEQIMVWSSEAHAPKSILTLGSSNLVILFAVSTSPKTLCSRVASSPTSIPSSTVMVDPTLSSCPSTAPSPASTTITVMALRRTSFIATRDLVRCHPFPAAPVFAR